ncbi:phosphatidylethanolamine-binding protein 1 [Trichonephila inaurata madagascariensis]|uniref:Phosphatidylethanolamine-binding protein 1 n=1 Tax=Trichonephila inaurata madagascariensis TaxID=2747483 RepID=A0A8X7C918_9ARAC|nr:phosphatidylethanolamine-binding protein 1 [Trichonephila inaurata madagascariensis]
MAFKLVQWIFVISSLCVSSLQGSCDFAKFQEKGIVPDIIREIPEKEIKVRYEDTPIECGEELLQNVTIHQPALTFTGLKDEKLHTLIMFDPDAPSPENPYLASYRHWVLEDIPGNEFYQGYTVSSYEGPNPPTHSDAHRYIFLVFEQPTSKKLRETFDDDKRANFKVNTFIKKRKLIGPLAGNFMYVRHL